MGRQKDKVLKTRYLKPDEKSESDMFRRVARALASNGQQQEDFFNVMQSKKFLPNTPCLVNAGDKSSTGSLFACFVLPIEDSMEGIFTTLKDTALIHKGGGGTGFNFGRLRPTNSLVKSTNGIASGPISFMTAYDAATETVKQGGCFVGGTLIATIDGAKKIKDLKEGDLVYSWDGELKLNRCTDSWKTKTNTEVWKLTTDKGLVVYATPNHPFMVRWSGRSTKKEYVKLRDLKANMPLMPLTRYVKKDGYTYISLNDGKDSRLPEHQWVAKQFGIEGEHIHHIDNNKNNNHPDNLQGMTNAEHLKIHSSQRYANEGAKWSLASLTNEQKNQSIESWKKWFYSLSEEELKEYKAKISVGVKDVNKNRILSGTHNFINNHPSTNPEMKIKQQKGQVASALWRVMGVLGKPLSEVTWKVDCKNAGLARPHRYTMSYIRKIFGSWDNAVEYANERNHRVVLVEFSHYEDVYNVEVPGPHNYIVCNENMSSGIVVSNTRRGANMGTIPIAHPDVLDFIKCKDDGTRLNNFNISVAITDDFIDAVKNDKEWKFSFDGAEIEHEHVKAKKIMDMIVEQAWKNGEPGVLFIDKVNETHPLPTQIESTNPCGVRSPQVNNSEKSVNPKSQLKIWEYRDSTEITGNCRA